MYRDPIPHKIKLHVVCLRSDSVEKTLYFLFYSSLAVVQKKQLVFKIEMQMLVLRFCILFYDDSPFWTISVDTGLALPDTDWTVMVWGFYWHIHMFLIVTETMYVSFSN